MVGDFTSSTEEEVSPARCNSKDTLCLVDYTPEHASHRATLDTASVMYDSSSSRHSRIVMVYADAAGPDNRGKGVLRL